MNQEVYKINSCRVCGHSGIKEFFDLGNHPLANSLLKSPNDSEKFYPLSLSFCKDCSLVQLNHTVDPKILFADYVWVTGTSGVANKFAETFADELLMRLATKGGYILEIASNDGTFLKPLLKKGYSVLGIDPAQNIVDMALESSVPTECAFFGSAVAEKIIARKGRAEAVFARNVLPHVANTVDFVKGLANVVTDDGIVAIEAHYAKVILEELHYDSIYHEHLCYFTLKSMEKLLNNEGLFIFDCVLSPISGGSVIYYAKKIKSSESKALANLRESEAKSRVNEFDSWKHFVKLAFEHKDRLRNSIKGVQDKGGKVVGYGASARSSTLLNFCGINSSMIPIVADKSPLKQKLYTAGSHLLIESPEVVMNEKPRAVFLMAWNFTDEVMKYLASEFNFKGTYIIPLPRSVRIAQSQI